MNLASRQVSKKEVQKENSASKAKKEENISYSIK